MYWLGVRDLTRQSKRSGCDTKDDGGEPQAFVLSQWEPYSTPGATMAATSEQQKRLPSAAVALEALRDTCTFQRQGQSRLRGRTSLCIIPGYRFQLCDALVTNFHTPDSTLLLLVGALMGKSAIDHAYKHAVADDYRFFSCECDVVTHTHTHTSYQPTCM